MKKVMLNKQVQVTRIDVYLTNSKPLIHQSPGINYEKKRE